MAGRRRLAVVFVGGSDPPTQAQVQAIEDGLVAAVRLLNEIPGAVVFRPVSP